MNLIKDFTEKELVDLIRRVIDERLKSLHQVIDVVKYIDQRFFEIEQGLIFAMKPPVSNVRRKRLLSNVRKLQNKLALFITNEKEERDERTNKKSDKENKGISSKEK